MQKTAPKNTKYSKNGTILKVGHLAIAIVHSKAIAFAKWSVWLKMPKKWEKPFYRNITVVLCKKPLQKRQNIIEEMRQF